VLKRGRKTSNRLLLSNVFHSVEDYEDGSIGKQNNVVADMAKAAVLAGALSLLALTMVGASRRGHAGANSPEAEPLDSDEKDCEFVSDVDQ